MMILKRFHAKAIWELNYEFIIVSYIFRCRWLSARVRGVYNRGNVVVYKKVGVGNFLFQ
jgi:hypothetical protein